MNKQLRKWAIGLVLGGIWTYGVVAFTRSNAQSTPEQPPRIAQSAPADFASAGPRSAAEGDMVARMAAVRETVLLGQAASNLPTPEATVDPVRLERAAFDARLADAPQNPREALRLRAELEPILQPGLLQGTAATLVCGSTMCRIDFADADDDNTNRALTAVAERLPKSFGGSTVYPTGNGERSLYVARNSSDLRLGEPLTEERGFETPAPL